VGAARASTAPTAGPSTGTRLAPSPPSEWLTPMNDAGCGAGGGDVGGAGTGAVTAAPPTAELVAEPAALQPPSVVAVRMQAEVLTLDFLAQQYHATGYMDYRFQLPDGHGLPPGPLEFAQIEAWSDFTPLPDSDSLLFLNGSKTVTSDCGFTLQPDGATVVGRIGWAADFSLTFDLRPFPFDRQVLSLHTRWHALLIIGAH
jgi:hypothetical protein